MHIACSGAGKVDTCNVGTVCSACGGQQKECSEKGLTDSDSSSKSQMFYESCFVNNGPTVLVEPDSLICPITLCLFQDPIFVAESGNTYERAALLQFWKNCEHPRDPFTNSVLSDTSIFTNWSMRRAVQGFLDICPKAYVPSCWDTRTPSPPADTSYRNIHARRALVEEYQDAKLLDKDEIIVMALVVLSFWSIYALFYWISVAFSSLSGK
jgi:hypothetical protein